MRIRLSLPRVGGGEVSLLSTFWAFALGAAGGFAARALGLPLPMLLGSVMAVGGVALSGMRPGGLAPLVPSGLRLWFIPVIGVAIGAAFTPQVLQDARTWWPSLVALLLFIPAAHAAGYALLRRAGGLSPVTAYYGSVPGGLIETVMMGEAAGADGRMLVMLQFMRLILCILLVPLGFALATGHPVGSSSGLVIGEADGALTAWDWAVLAVAGALGATIGHRLRFPAAFMTGPLLASGFAHLAGWVEGAPPGWAVDLTQLVVGTSLGGRFAGMAPRAFVMAVRLSVLNVLVVLALAGLAAAVLHDAVGERWEAVFLAFAPGGLAEMSLVALSLEISVLYVTAHHVARIMLSVSFAKLFSGALGRERGS